MPRDSSGNYTLPAGINPVVTGSTIASSWANTTLNDIATEITDSLDRSGKGGMLAAFKVIDGTVSAPGFAFQSETGTGIYRISAGVMGVATLGALRLQIGPNGTMTLSQPGSGTAFSLTVASGGIYATSFTSGGATTDYSVSKWVGLAATGYVGVGNSAASNVYFQNAMVIGTQSAHTFCINTNDTGRVTVSSVGAVVINAATSGRTLSVNGLANNYTVAINGSSTTGQSLGLIVQAGTNGTDAAVSVLNQSGSSTYFSISGNGVVQGNDGSSLIELGYKDIPQNAQGSNYTTVMADRGKVLSATGAITFTIAANASVAYPIGTVLTFANLTAGNISIAINTDSMTLAATTTTGTRTLAQNGVATAIKLTATGWIIAGTGLS